LEITCSFGHNTLYNIEDNQSSNYTSGSAVCAEISVGFDVASLPGGKFIIFSGIENYKGSFSHSHNGKWQGNGTYGKMEKTNLSLGFFPLNFKILNKVELNIGFQYSVLLDGEAEGEQKSWYSYNLWPDTTTSFDGADFIEKEFIGLKLRAKYPIKLSPTTVVSPTITSLIGITSEIKNAGKPQSIRNYLGVGVSKIF